MTAVLGFAALVGGDGKSYVFFTNGADPGYPKPTIGWPRLPGRIFELHLIPRAEALTPRTRLSSAHGVTNDQCAKPATMVAAVRSGLRIDFAAIQRSASFASASPSS